MKSMLLAAATLVATPVLAAPGSASSALQAMSETNLIVLGNMTGGHDVEGKSFVGGNISGNTSNYGIGNAATTGSRAFQGEASSSRPTVTVGGNINGANLANGSNGGSGTIAARKSVDIGGSFTGGNFNVDGALIRAGSNLAGFNINGGTDVYYGVSASGFQNTQPVKDATLAPGGSNDLHASIAAQTATLTADLSALSTALYGLSASGSFDGTDPNNARLIASDPAHRGFAVIDITASNLASFLGAANLVYSLPTVGSGYLPTIVNVSGATSYTLNANSNNSAYNPYVLFNFGGATSIMLNRQFNGGLLAYAAAVSNSTPIEGSVAVGSFNQGGEIHLGTFKGNAALTAAVTPMTTGAVPEPASWALFITGFAAVGVMRRRKTAVAA